jgi:UDP-glucose 4-epimerase
MKLASEAQICAARESFLKHANIFRFPNVVGAPATHGVILDFINKLMETTDHLEVLGNGSQKKSYLHVSELIEAMIYVSELDHKNNAAEIVNIGCGDDGILVSDIAKLVTKAVAPNANIKFGLSDRGWVGDVPRFSYDISYLKSLGWTPRMTSHQAVSKAIEDILQKNVDNKL